MKKKIVKFIVMIQVLMSCFVFESIAFNDLEAGAYLWKLINEARARPAKAIEAYGIDYDSAKLALGDDVWILELENGLPPLASNRLLQETSSAHNLDMINGLYYSHNSPKGLSFNDRIVESGYDPVVTGESLGILAFYIYVDPVKAVEGIFENMIRDELNPELNYPKNIFGKEFTEIGISFISTTFSFGKDSTGKDSILNAYVVTADFGKPVEARSYILGNIYNKGESQPDQLVLNIKSIPANDFAVTLLSYKGWYPDKSSNSFILWAYNITGKSSVEVPQDALGSYQIEIPANTFYAIELYSKVNDDTLEHNYIQGNLLKRIVNVGLNVNKMVDFGID